MSENGKAQSARYAPGARFGARFWEEVEYEVEALDAADFELFIAADELPIEPRQEALEALVESLAVLCRARFSN